MTGIVRTTGVLSLSLLQYRSLKCSMALSLVPLSLSQCTTADVSRVRQRLLSVRSAKAACASSGIMPGYAYKWPLGGSAKESGPRFACACS